MHATPESDTPCDWLLGNEPIPELDQETPPFVVTTTGADPPVTTAMQSLALAHEVAEKL
jgi:hypothetical protein